MKKTLTNEELYELEFKNKLLEINIRKSQCN